MKSGVCPVEAGGLSFFALSIGVSLKSVGVFLFDTYPILSYHCRWEDTLLALKLLIFR